MKNNSKIALLNFGMASTWATTGVLALSVRGVLPWVTLPLSLIFIALVAGVSAVVCKLVLATAWGAKLLESKFASRVLGLSWRGVSAVLIATAMLRLLVLALCHR